MFIGQGAGSKKGGGGGMKQAEQKKVLADFRAGLYNTMVATCIGEEGLDIPQVRHCTAFQRFRVISNNQSIRLLQSKNIELAA